MEDKKLQLIKTFIEWVFKDYPSIWVKGPKNQFWYEQNKFNIIWDDNYEYSFFNPDEVKTQPESKLYRRTMLVKGYKGGTYAKTATTSLPENYGDPKNISGEYTFIKWLDNWTEVRK